MDVHGGFNDWQWALEGQYFLTWSLSHILTDETVMELP